jgi:hypothetical protein
MGSVNQDHVNTGTVHRGDAPLGFIVVVHPGHPLVGQVVPVARRYGRRNGRQWVIELPDGSRQYIPVTWCTPLATAQGDHDVAARDPDRRPPPPMRSSPLTLTALRDLAARVRQLQEADQQRGEQHHHGRTAADTEASQQTDRDARPPDGGDTAEPPAVGELRAYGPPAVGPDAAAGGASAGNCPGASGTGAGEVSR